MASPSAALATPRINTCSHCLFDMDGLLLDTETLYTVAQQQVLARYGREFTWELKSKMMGRKALEAAQVLVDDLGLQGVLAPEDFLKEREALLDQLFATAPLMPGAERLIRHLARHDVPMAVATSSHRRHYELKTGMHQELFSLFTHIVTGDQVQRSKPAPDIFLKAAGLFTGPDGSEAGPSPSSCLVFEDAPLGVDAALAAGMHVVMVPDANLDRSLTKTAHQTLRSLQDFKPQDWGLPPFPDDAAQRAALSIP